MPHLPPIEPTNTPDYYFENGMMVMTESYLLKQGKCCSSGCRHCPYDDPAKKTGVADL